MMTWWRYIIYIIKQSEEREGGPKKMWNEYTDDDTAVYHDQPDDIYSYIM